MDRRQFLAMVPATLAMPWNASSATTRPMKWGVQLFTVLEPLEKDFEGTLQAIAAMGYREVETIGSFGRDPAYVRGVLDRCGLVSPSQHIAPSAVYERFAAWTRRELTLQQITDAYVAAFQVDKAMDLVVGAIKQAKVLGQRFIVWPILFEAQLADRAILRRYTDLFNKAGQMCEAEGLRFAFHNHNREFARLGPDVIYDIILADTDPKLVAMEMDFYWISKAGADPFHYLAHYPNRFRAVHVKDMSTTGDFAMVGSGTLPIARMIAAARTVGVTHYFVEYDRSDDPMGDILGSIKFLERL